MMFGVYVVYKIGGYLNLVVIVGLVIVGKDLVFGIFVMVGNIMIYIFV